MLSQAACLVLPAAVAAAKDIVAAGRAAAPASFMVHWASALSRAPGTDMMSSSLDTSGLILRSSRSLDRASLLEVAHTRFVV